MWRKKNHEAASAAAIHQLTASRRKIAEAYEIERLRIERDLHDGAQQHFVAAAMRVGEAQLEAEGVTAHLLETAAKDLRAGLDALRHTVRGIHPRELTDRGLVAAIEAAAAQYGPTWWCARLTPCRSSMRPCSPQATFSPPKP